MRKLYPYVAAVLLYAFTPGLCELAEVAVHFVETGDVHASDQERHAEHGDSKSKGQDGGECHTCICHAHTVFVAPMQATLVPIPVEREMTLFVRIDGASDGAIRELFRPPIA